MKTALSVIKFAAGFLSNLVCQTARSATNAAAAMTMACVCIAKALLAALQFAGGGSKHARKSAGEAWDTARYSLKACTASVLQAAGVVTLISPTIRAAQACSEAMSPNGVFVPAGKGRNFWQDTFGINSWGEPEATAKPAPAQTKTPIQKKAAAADHRTTKVIAKKATNDHRTTKVIVKKAPATKAKPKANWSFIVEQYLSAKTIDEMNSIRSRMAVGFPKEYANALAEASRSTRRRKRVA